MTYMYHLRSMLDERKVHSFCLRHIYINLSRKRHEKDIQGCLTNYSIDHVLSRNCQELNVNDTSKPVEE